MCLEFLDVSLRPFATHCFAVLLWLRNFQLVSSLFDGGRVLTHRRAETTKQKLKIAPSRQRKWSADDQNGAIDRDKARRLKTTFWRVITIGCACRLVATILGMPASVPNYPRRVPNRSTRVTQVLIGAPAILRSGLQQKGQDASRSRREQQNR